MSLFYIHPSVDTYRHYFVSFLVFCRLIRAVRLRHYVGGGAPVNFGRRRWRRAAGPKKSAAAAAKRFFQRFPEKFRAIILSFSIVKITVKRQAAMNTVDDCYLEWQTIAIHSISVYDRNCQGEFYGFLLALPVYRLVYYARQCVWKESSKNKHIKCYFYATST